MNLNDAELGKEYIIKDVDTGGDEEIKSFLFSLGCYSGETITVVDKKRNLVVSIKDARYNIDKELAESIQIQAFTSNKQIWGQRKMFRFCDI